MAWYDKAVFYHIYPLGLCGCAKENTGVSEQHFEQLNQFVEHIKKIGCTAIYIGPLFESVGHGYETIDYKKVDCRLGTNQDFKEYVKNCHAAGLKVIVDGVFNHVGREFFAFKDLKEHRENSQYKDWFCNVNFWNNNEYDDHFSYDNWGGYNLLVKLNQRNPQVKDFIYDVIRFWIKEFDIDGIRLDAADVLDHDFMAGIRSVCDQEKQEFWLMGEVIHGNYSQWANGQQLHSVTNYELHKALYSGHNDHNYFEIAHTVQRSLQLNGDVKLYSFVDNHDVERINTKLNNKEHLFSVTLLLYGLPGIPSIYYGSEFCIEGRKERGSDASLRPYLKLDDYKNAYENNRITKLIMTLGQLKKTRNELSYGHYEQLLLTNRQYAFARVSDQSCVIVVANNDENPADVWVRMPMQKKYTIDLLEPVFGKTEFRVENGQLVVHLESCGGTMIYIGDEQVVPVNIHTAEANADESNNFAVQSENMKTEDVNSGSIFEMSDRLRQQMEFVLEVDKEKLINRQSYLADSSRKENDSEHAWHLALMTMILSEYSNEKIDALKTMAMLLIHDVVEIDAGDTYAYDEIGQATQREREVKAAERIFNILPQDQAKYFRELWDEFEEAATPEAKFANAIDGFQPLLLNNATDGRAWREHGVSAAQVLAREEQKVKPGSETLFEYIASLIQENKNKGNLK